MSRTALYAPVETRPVYTRKSDTLLKLFPASPSTSYSVSNVTCNYVAKPADVSWAYTEVNGTALFNSASAVDFELHASEEKNLVIKILALAGISIDDSGLYQIASQENAKEIQQEKQ